MDLRLKILLGTIVILVAGGITAAVVATVKGGSSGGGQPKLTVETASFDFGDVPMSGGMTRRDIKIQNTGDADLKISQIITSCMCTTVTLEAGGVRSPAFGMPGHGPSAPAFWSATLKPGESGNLEIVFDPNAHGPDAVGPITRAITIFSNSGGRAGSKTTINFDGNVVKGEAAAAKNTEGAAEILSASKNGVEVRIVGVKKENDKTLVDFTADNHAIDLSKADVKNFSKLSGAAPINYEVVDGGGGGHHLAGRLTFKGELSGSLVMGFSEDLTFNLAIK